MTSTTTTTAPSCSILFSFRGVRRAAAAVSRTEKFLAKTHAAMARIEARPRWNGKLRSMTVPALDIDGKPVVKDGQPVTERIFLPVTMRQQFQRLTNQRRAQQERLAGYRALLRAEIAFVEAGFASASA